MSRIVVAYALASLLAPTAFAKNGPEVCVLQATETITAPRKPNLFNMKIDCGSEVSMEQESAAAYVNSLVNTADAVSYMIGLGYEIGSATTMVSYTGNAIISTYTLVKGKGGGMSTPTMTGPGMPDDFDLPEADDEAEPEADDDGTLGTEEATETSDESL